MPALDGSCSILMTGFARESAVSVSKRDSMPDRGSNPEVIDGREDNATDAYNCRQHQGCE